MGNFRFVALDVETACSDAASICQIGLACVQLDDEIQTFSMLVNPRSRFDSFNIRLHGIGPDHVAQAPGFAEALAMLLPLLTRHQLVQHSNFDKQAVNAACRTCGLDGRFVACRPEQVPTDQVFDEIWSNPPVRIGKAALHDLLLRWLPRLAPGGRAVLVVGKNLGADSLQRWLGEQGYPTTRLASAKGFRVLEARPAGGNPGAAGTVGGS